MKKKGNKKKVSSSRRKKKFFLFNNKVAPIVIIAVVALLVLAILLSLFGPTGNVAGNVSSGSNASANPVNNPAPTIVINLTRWLNIGTSWKDIIIGFIVLAIIFAMLFDILTLTSIFSGWVAGIIAGGLAVIAALTDIIRNITIWFATVFAGLGVAAGFIEIGIALVIFVGLAFGSSRIAIWAAKRRAQAIHIRAIKKSAEVSGAITGLKAIWEQLKK